jgi:hypothetical protein
MKIISLLLRNFGETVAIAQLTKELYAELERRAEYALRYGVHDRMGPDRVFVQLRNYLR